MKRIMILYVPATLEHARVPAVFWPFRRMEHARGRVTLRKIPR